MTLVMWAEVIEEKPPLERAARGAESSKGVRIKFQQNVEAVESFSMSALLTFWTTCFFFL